MCLARQQRHGTHCDDGLLERLGTQEHRSATELLTITFESLCEEIMMAALAEDDLFFW